MSFELATDTAPPELKGFGGFLILPMIRVGFDLILLSTAVWRCLAVLRSPLTLSQGTGLTLLLLAMNLALLGLLVLLVLHGRLRSSRTPRLFIGFVLAHGVVTVIETILFNALVLDPADPALQDQAGQVAVLIASALIWIAYSLRSVRVRNTFVVPTEGWCSPVPRDYGWASSRAQESFSPTVRL